MKIRRSTFDYARELELGPYYLGCDWWLRSRNGDGRFCWDGLAEYWPSLRRKRKRVRKVWLIVRVEQCFDPKGGTWRLAPIISHAVCSSRAGCFQRVADIAQLLHHSDAGVARGDTPYYWFGLEYEER